MNANELTALIGECLRETDDHEFFLKLESVLRQQQAEIEELKLQVGVWEKEAMNARIKMSLYQAEIKELRKVQEK